MDFWNQICIASLMAVHDYYEDQEAQHDKWQDFCQKCTQEIMDECCKIADTVHESAEDRLRSDVPLDLLEGVKLLPLYSFYLVLRKQNEITEEQGDLIQLFLANIDVPYTMDMFQDAVNSDNYDLKPLIEMVGISEDYAGRFWIVFFNRLYRNQNRTEYISKLIDSFSYITMRFAALNRQPEERVVDILKTFIKNVQEQAERKPEITDNNIDFFGNVSFVEHYDQFKESAYKICRFTMEEDDPDFNPDIVIIAFSIGVVYQIISRCTGTDQQKEEMMGDVLSRIDVGIFVNGADMYREIGAAESDDATGIPMAVHMLTDLDDGKPMGWIILSRAGGTYNLKTREEADVLEKACSFVSGIENYLAERYPGCGFGNIASNYANRAVEIVLQDFDENVTVIDGEDKAGKAASIQTSDKKEKASSKKAKENLLTAALIGFGIALIAVPVVMGVLIESPGVAPMIKFLALLCIIAFIVFIVMMNSKKRY